MHCNSLLQLMQCHTNSSSCASVRLSESSEHFRWYQSSHRLHATHRTLPDFRDLLTLQGLALHSSSSLLLLPCEKKMILCWAHFILNEIQNHVKILILYHFWSKIVTNCSASLKVFYRSEEHTSELQSPVPISYAVFCLKKKNKKQRQNGLSTI